MCGAAVRCYNGVRVLAHQNETMTKYLFFDIDGTLAAGPIGNRVVPEGTRDALLRLRKNGHFTAICTGRSHAMARSYMEEQGFTNMVADGGNSTVIDGNLLGIEPLDRKRCIQVLEECDRLKIPWAVSADDSNTRLSIDGRFADLVEKGYMVTKTVPNLDYHAIPRFYKLYIAVNAEDEKRITTLDLVPHVHFSDTCLFVEPIDKSRGIMRIMEHLGAPIEDVVVFGDGMNDLSMFDPRWLSIAMGNAVQPLKDAADYITANADDDGIRKACEHFGWI